VTYRTDTDWRADIERIAEEIEVAIVQIPVSPMAMLEQVAADLRTLIEDPS
jgi:hypothetical protein